MPVRKAPQKDRSSAVVTPAGTASAPPSRGLVDAPGKRHRKPPPQERVDDRLGEPTGKQMGQKSVKAGWRAGRR